MNKKISVFYIVTVAVAITCLILDMVMPNSSFSYLGICLGVTMLVYGITLIIRAFVLKIDASMFLGVIIFSFGVVTTLTYFTPFSYVDLWHYLLLGVSLASFATGIYFKVPAQKKLAGLFLGFFVIAFIYQQLHLFKLWIMFVLMLIWLVGFIVGNNIIMRRRRM